MLFVIFHVGDDRYAVEGREVIEIVPLVPLKVLPHAPREVAGLFNYRGMVVPVIDLCAMIGEASCRKILSSRILLVSFPASDGTLHPLGLLAERVVETMTVSKSDLLPMGIDLEDSPYLGKLICREGRVIQCVRIEHLLPDSVRKMLFRKVEDGEEIHEPPGW